jgi:hypothetical protein
MARPSWWIGAVWLGATWIAAGALWAQDTVVPARTGDNIIRLTDIDTPMAGQSIELPGEACCPDSGCGERRLGFIGNADYLHWYAGLKGLEFASVAQAPLASPPAAVGSEALDFGANSGFRGGLGYRFASQWDVTWNVTYFRNQTTGAVVDNGLLTTVLLAPQSVFNTTPMAAIQADATLRLSIHDIEANYYACLDEPITFRVFGGLRLAEIDQQFETAYALLSTASQGRISLPAEMDAAGGRMGAEICRRTESGFRLFGRGGISYLAADFHTRRRETLAHQIDAHGTLGTPQVVLDLDQTTTRFVSVLEGAAGLGWESGPLALDVGYEMNSWINIVGADGTVQDLQVRGLFVRLAYVH